MAILRHCLPLGSVDSLGHVGRPSCCSHTSWCACTLALGACRPLAPETSPSPTTGPRLQLPLSLALPCIVVEALVFTLMVAPADAYHNRLAQPTAWLAEAAVTAAVSMAVTWALDARVRVRAARRAQRSTAATFQSSVQANEDGATAPLLGVMHARSGHCVTTSEACGGASSPDDSNKKSN
jgi:hypothetical protein